MSDAWRTSLDLEGRPAARVDWLPAAPTADLAAHRPWRAAVGPARVANAGVGNAVPAALAAPAAPAAPVAPAPTAHWPLAVAVWNARVGGGAMRAFWEHLPTGVPTVLLLQEVFATGSRLPELSGNARWAARIADRPRDEGRIDIVTFARETGLSLLYVPSMRNGGPGADRSGDPGAGPGGDPGAGPPDAGPPDAGPPDVGPPEDRGCAILANVPLARPRAIELPFERQRRVAVAASVTLGDHTIDLCSVHLDNRAPWRRVWRSLGAARHRQMAGLLDVFPAPAGDRAHAHVLGGDLNTWVGGRRESAYRVARQRFPLPERPDSRPTHHFEIGGWLRHSDHLMLRLPAGWRADCRRLEDTFGSDHYPLVGSVAGSDQGA